MATTMSIVKFEVSRDILSTREVQVLSLIIEGRSSQEVATFLYLSKRTVDFHLARIYEKLNVTNRVQAIRRASELGLVHGELA